MEIALVSLNQIWEDKEANIALCKEYIKKASNEKVDLIIFPEMTLTGFSNNIQNISEYEDNSQSIRKFQKLAKKYEIAIIFGVVINDGAKAKNCSYFVDNKGLIISSYSKIHPFTFAGEDKYYNAGNKLSIVDFKNHSIGLSICYDLRFPELYSSLSKSSDIIVNIANWPKKRVDHWSTLLKARAIENQIYVIGVNSSGTDGNALEYEESSTVYNANGEELKYKHLDDMKIFEIDKNWTDDFKKQFITVKDRKTSFYKEIL